MSYNYYASPLVCALAIVLGGCKSKQERALDALESKVVHLEKMQKKYQNASEDDFEADDVATILKDFSEAAKIIESIDMSELDEKQTTKILQLSARLGKLQE